MSQDKLSKFELAKALAIIGVVITIYMVVSDAVLRAFWWLVFKLFSKVTKK